MNEETATSRLEALWGTAGLARQRAATVMVVGAGGVGSNCIEALARGAVGTIIVVDGDEVALTPIEFNILRLLMKNPGRIYSSAQIYELVWKEDSLGAETSVSVHIRHLRQKLEINPSEPRYLKVVWGLGYKMEDKK